MRLLLLTPQLPYPLHQGTSIRNFNLIKHLAPWHEITLLSFGTPEELDAAAPLRDLCRHIEIAVYPNRSLPQRAAQMLVSSRPDMALRLKSSAMHAHATALVSAPSFDVVQVEGIEMARYALEQSSGTTPRVFDDHNAEYVLQRTAFRSDAHNFRRWHAALYSLIQWKKLQAYERHACRIADHVVACSETDANAIRTLMQVPSDAGFPVRPTTSSGLTVTPVTVIPNGVDTGHFVPSVDVCAKPLSKLSMVFTGKMDFRPNVDGTLWFCGEILPRVRAQIPLAHVVIVGQRPAAAVGALAGKPGVQVTGAVPDIRPFVADAAVYVVPLRMGSGTRLKVLEAMAMGKAIVSTQRGVEGIDVVPGRHALIADSPDGFARELVDLLHDPERRQALGRAARELVVARYDWRNIVGAFDTIYDRVRRK